MTAEIVAGIFQAVPGVAPPIFGPRNLDPPQIPGICATALDPCAAVYILSAFGERMPSFLLRAKVDAFGLQYKKQK
jgi:hypothetical protein